MSSFIGIGAVSGILYVAGIALVIIAAIKAKEGENYTYPFTIKFIKLLSKYEDRKHKSTDEKRCFRVLYLIHLKKW
jgi:hypothetical protein